MSDPLVIITRCSTLLSAQLARARLAAEGIEAHLPEESSASVLGEHFEGFGGLRVLVRQTQAARACELLGISLAAQESPPEPAQDALCPVCRAPLPRSLRASLRWVARIAAAFGRASGRSCAVCGHRPHAA